MRAFLVPFFAAALLFAGIVMLSRARQADLAQQEAATPPPAPAPRRIERPVRTDVRAFVQAHPMVERRLTPEQRAADLEPDLLDAVLRIEGIFDPTRIGVFGKALRMQVRPGTASMTNIFGDAWRRADADPNLHYRTSYLAAVWLAPGRRGCEAFTRFRPDEALIGLDRPTAGDCARLDSALEAGVAADVIAAGPLSLPVFCAPYPGARLSLEELYALQEARSKLVRAQMWFHGPAKSPLTGSAGSKL